MPRSAAARPAGARSGVALTPADVLAPRMSSLLLRPGARPAPRDVAGVVEWFGAM